VPGAAAARARARASMDRGLAFLRQKQEADGSWNHYPGITALCVLAFLDAGTPAKDPAVARGTAFLASLVKPNGAIYTDALGRSQELPNYNTAGAMMALNATRDPRYRPLVVKAQHYLETSEYDEGEGFNPRDWQYGGMGYGTGSGNPDLSNLQQALEALNATGYPQNGPAFQKAITFLQRCQNRGESNDQAWAGSDGGFVYAANGNSKADEFTKQAHSSYGSMTYAGLKSYLYCGVSKSDPRAQAAYQWIKANYTVDENPRMRNDGLFYYYHTMSKTLAVYGDKVLTDSRGNRHYWAPDLIDALARRQRPDGSWTNSDRRWQEDNGALVTAYGVISLSNCLKGL
jgi:squalene-hopene/tetraprenyl-beta-curcumene cyclase